MTLRDFKINFTKSKYYILNSNFPVVDEFLKILDKEGFLEDRSVQNRAERLHAINFRRFVMISTLTILVKNYTFLMGIIDNYGKYDDILEIFKWNSLVRYNITEMYRANKEFFYNMFNCKNKMAVIHACLKANKIGAISDFTMSISSMNKFILSFIDPDKNMISGVEFTFIKDAAENPEAYDLHNYDIDKIEDHAHYLLEEHNIDI